MRWEDALIAHDGGDSNSVSEFWEAAADRHTAVILGDGFDPRALVGLEAVVAAGLDADLSVATIELPQQSAGGEDKETPRLAEKNRDRLATLRESHGIQATLIQYPDVADPSSAGQQIAWSLLKSDFFDSVDHVIVDVSALPSSVYFPIVAALLKLWDEGSLEADIQVLVCENSRMDDAIVDEGTTSGRLIGGFRGGLQYDASPDQLKVWAPVLGSRQEVALRTLYEHLEPQEVCPVLPFPARRPRRADDLILEYRQWLFEEVEFEPRNLIYADEHNPFDLYRALTRLHRRYGEALRPLGPSSVVLSTHSSKLLSVGVLLAAYEHDLPVIMAGPTSYRVADGIDLETLEEHNSLACVWLCGAPYRASGEETGASDEE